jgi:hypothetical protein
MRIQIKSIEADLLDTSTFEEESCIVSYWIIKYHIVFYNPYLHSIDGTLAWKEIPNITDIIKHIEKHYVNKTIEDQT